MPQQLERERRAVRGIAHDLNNLLTAMANECVEHAEHAGQEVGEVLGAFERARLLVRRLLQDPEEPAPVDVAQVLEELRPTLGGLLARDTIRFHVSVEAGLPPVYGRSQDLEQVAGNLVVNAAQALRGSSGDVTVSAVSTRRGGRGWVRLRVEDTGPGIVPEDLSRVFEAGFSTKGSTGLGLALVRDTVAEMRGTIEVHPTARGACFDIYLPVVAERLG